MYQPDGLKRDVLLDWSAGRGPDLWALFVACAAGDLAGVRSLVAKDPTLVRGHWDYHTPLIFAVRENRIEVARFLLDHGAKPFDLFDVRDAARDRDYVDMLAMLEAKILAIEGGSPAGEPAAAAIRDRDLARLRQLLDESPDRLGAGDLRSNQPIHWAVMTRQIPVIDELLARGADINAKRSDGASPILLTNGDYHYRGWRDVPAGTVSTADDIYRHLVARGADVPLGMAAFKGDFDRVRAIVDRDPALVNRDAYTTYYAGGGAPLKNAVLSGRMDIVEFLLAHGADPNLREEGIAPFGHALYAAIYHHHDAIARLLLERGANPDQAVESSADAVWIAIKQGRLDVVQLLASAGATWRIPLDPESGITYEQIVSTGLKRDLVVLAHFGDTRAAEALIAADPAAADNPEALKEAARYPEFVDLLLRHRPDLASRVTVSRPLDMVVSLFERGMDPNRRNWLGRTPLHDFAEQGRLKETGLFLDRGADIHARDDVWRSTPLAYAARSGKVKMVEFLLGRGAKPTLPDDPAWATPREWARKRGHLEVMAVLDAAGPSS
jgi:ankyrin repeat protein